MSAAKINASTRCFIAFHGYRTGRNLVDLQ